MTQNQVLHHFCTLFDCNYLLKGVAMIRSLAQQCPGAHVHVLCMDTQSGPILQALGLPVTCIALAELETDELRAAKRDRSVAEYCWTLSPSLPWHVLQRNPDIDFVTYVDADLLFYSPVQPLFDEIGRASIAIIEHRFTPRLQHLEVNGRFCVEWVSFRRDEQGMACLDRWRRQCIEWCYYRLEGNRMGDQKYLDEWPELYPSLHILKHPGAGIAPWNYAQYRFERDAKGVILVDGSPLVFYHFHQFQLLTNGRFDRLSTFYTSERQEPLAVYEAYEAILRRVLGEVRGVLPGFSGGLKQASQVGWRRLAQKLLPRCVKDTIRRFVKV
jgi:hypothetical protein